MADSESQHPFSDDRPIVTAADDLLGRAPFAKRIAKAVSNWKGNDSLVIGLMGEWGSGKTSVANMVIEELRKLHQTNGSRSLIARISPWLKRTRSRPYVIVFNPWQWAVQEKLTLGFFAEIEHELRKAGNDRLSRRAANKLRQYATVAGLGGSADASLMSWVKVLGTALAVGSVTTPVWADSLSTMTGISIEFIQWTALVVGLVGILFVLSSRLASAIAARIDRRQDFGGNIPLRELKSELANQLRGLGSPVVMVIDDIDRLSTKEMKLLFQLVKANADLPSIIYLLLFQRDSVEHALDEVAKGNGPAYLEKIVQVPFDLPALERSQVLKNLVMDLNQLLGKLPAGANFDTSRWREIYQTGLSPYFRTLRGVRRFVSIIGFAFEAFTDGDHFDANPVDLISIEALRMFEPSVYADVKMSKELFTNTFGGISPEGPEKDIPAAFDRITKNGALNQDAAAHILRQLFPMVDHALRGSSSGSVSPNWLKELRVCHPEVFDRYFEMTLRESDVSQAEVRYLLSNQGDRRAFGDALRKLQERNRAKEALDYLVVNENDLVADLAETAITALFDVGDDLAPPLPSLDRDAAMVAIELVDAYLNKVHKGNRVAILNLAAVATKGIYLPISVFSHIIGAPALHDDSDSPSILGRNGLSLIERAAKDGRLAESQFLDRILLQWKEWDETDQSKFGEWLLKLSKGDGGILTILRAFRKIEPGPSGIRRSNEVDITQLQKLVALTKIGNRVSEIRNRTDELSDENNELLDSFMKELDKFNSQPTMDEIVNEIFSNGDDKEKT